MTEDEEVGLDYDEAWKKVRKEHSEILSATGREGGWNSYGEVRCLTRSERRQV